jgi:hypothetical protein
VKKAYYPGLTNLAILDGSDDLSSWDEEELRRGQRRNKHGQWPNNPPKLVPKRIHDELVKRKLTKAYDLMNESIYDAVAILIELAKDTRVESSVRLKAVTEILDRTIGKKPIEVKLEVTKLERAFEAMLVPGDEDVDDDRPSLSPSGERGTHRFNKNNENDILDAEIVENGD